jgi:hypothetical protein
LTHHFVAWLEFVDARSDRRHFTRDITAEDCRQLDFDVLFHRAAADFVIHRIDAGRYNPHQHFARTGTRLRYVFVAKLVDATVLMQ